MQETAANSVEKMVAYSMTDELYMLTQNSYHLPYYPICREYKSLTVLPALYCEVELAVRYRV